MTALPAILTALSLVLTPLAAAAQAETPDSDVDTTQKPNWPGSLDHWESGERNPDAVEPDAARRRGLTTPEVQRSQLPPPTEQGTRPPSSTADGGNEEGAMAGWTPLYAALARTRRAPAAIDGSRLRRPNRLASEPTTEMQPVGGPASLFAEGYVE